MNLTGGDGCSILGSVQVGFLTLCSYYREVHKARHRASGAMVALKKILMHNAKEEGVSFETMFLLRFSSMLTKKKFLVSNNGAAGD